LTSIRGTRAGAIAAASPYARPTEVLQNTYGHHHPDYLQGPAAAIGQRGRYVSVVESVVDLGTANDQNKKSNDFWSEWQDLNLRPLRPERK
jgi:hypothetical protein